MSRSTAKGPGYASAAASGVIANVILGASSLFWRELGAIAPTTLLGYRILMSLATLALVMLVLRKFSGFRGKLSVRVISIHALAACLVVVNWGTFIWASIHGNVVESGLGYLIAPFVAIGVAAIFMRDPISTVRLGALVIIAAAILALLLRSIELSHWIYFVIGVTWGGYACLKKFTSLDSFGGLFIETMFLVAIWIALLLATPITLSLPAGLPIRSVAVLLICGVVSVVPLWLFAHAASKLPLSVMGFFQFVLPTTQLLVAVVVYRQPMSVNTLICFSVVWTSLLAIVAEPLCRKPKQHVTSSGVKS